MYYTCTGTYRLWRFLVLLGLRRFAFSSVLFNPPPRRGMCTWPFPSSPSPPWGTNELSFRTRRFAKSLPLRGGGRRRRSHWHTSTVHINFHSVLSCGALSLGGVCRRSCLLLLHPFRPYIHSRRRGVFRGLFRGLLGFFPTSTRAVTRRSLSVLTRSALVTGPPTVTTASIIRAIPMFPRTTLTFIWAITVTSRPAAGATWPVLSLSALFLSLLFSSKLGFLFKLLSSELFFNLSLFGCRINWFGATKYGAARDRLAFIF